MRKISFVLIFIFAFAIFPAFAEEVTITTYYPAPTGVYKDLTSGIYYDYNDPAYQAGGGYLLDPYPDSATPDNEISLTVAGKVGIGTTAPSGKLHLDHNANTQWDAIYDAHGSTSYANILLRRSRGSQSQPAVIYPNDTLGSITWSGYNDDVLAYIPAAQILGVIDVTASSDDMPGRLVFATTGDGNNSLSERMRIDSNGNVGIGTTDPKFKLSLDSDGGIIAKGTYDQGAILPSIGSGSQLIWYPRKAAFRVGYGGSNWEDGNIGTYSTALGYDTKASGSLSTAIGNDAQATNLGSVAIGNQATATGFNSTAIGYHATAQAAYSTVIGRYNIISGDLNQWYPNEPLFVIGNGGTFAPSNAVTVLKNGNVGIGTAEPSSKLAVIGLLPTGGYVLKYIPGTGAIGYENSSLRYKDNLQILQDDFYKIFQLVPKSFTYKNGNKENDIGYIAEEVDELGLKNLVIYDKENRPDALKYDKLPLYILEVMKDQQKTIEELKAKNKEFENRLKLLEAKLK